MILAAALAAALACAVLTWLALRGFRIALARYREVYTRDIRLHLSEVFLFIDPARLWAANLLLCVAAGIVGALLLRQWPAVLAAVAASAILPRHLLSRWRRNRLHRLDAQLPDALLALAGGLRAGAAVSIALRQVAAEAPAPLTQELGLLLREQRLGVSFDQALINFGARLPTEACTLCVSAMRIAADTGGNLAEVLERIAALVRARLHMQGRIDALTAQGRLQAWIVAALPVLLVLALSHLEPEAMATLWDTPMGWATLALVVALEAVGLVLIRRIVRVDV